MSFLIELFENGKFISASCMIGVKQKRAADADGSPLASVPYLTGRFLFTARMLISKHRRKALKQVNADPLFSMECHAGLTRI
jgi:hypothetical protein